MTTPEVVSTLPVPDCRCVRISPDGTSVLTVGAGVAEVRESLTGHLGWSRDWQAMAEFPVEAVWSAAGDTVTLLSGGALSLLDAATGADRPVPSDLATRRNVTALTLSPDGLTLAVGTNDGNIVLWRQNRGEALRLRGGGDPVTALAWHPSGEELCVARPRSIQFWHLPAGTMISSIDVGDTYPRRIAWAPDGDPIVVAGLREIRAVNVATRSESAQPLELGGQPTGLDFSRTGSTLLAGMPDGSVQMLDRRLLRAGPRRAGTPASVTEAACLHVNETGMAAIRTSTETVTLFRLPDTVLPTPAQLLTVSLTRWAAGAAGSGTREPAPPPFPTVIARKSRFAWADDGWYTEDLDRGTVARITADGRQVWTSSPRLNGPLSVHDRFVAVGGTDRLTVLDAATGATVAAVPGAGAASWSRYGPAIASPDRRDLLIYNPSVTTARTVPVPDGAGAPAWSPDGNLLAAASGNAVVLWDGATGQRIRRLPCGAAPRPGAVLWSPDGRLLAIDRPGAPVNVWSTATWLPGEPLAPSPAGGHAEAMAWSPDSRLLAVPARHPVGSVDLWDVRRGRIALTVPPPAGGRPVRTVAWAADGRFAVAHDDGTVVGWRLTLPERVDGENLALAHPPHVLAALVAATAASGGPAALAMLSDLLSLLLGQDAGPLTELDGHPGVALLRGLRWPPPAVSGLAVLVAAGLPAGDGSAPPDGAVEEDLRAALERVLEDAPAPARRYPPPIAELIAELDRVDDSVLVLASVLGPDAVAAEPGLLARVRGQSLAGWSLAPRQRTLIGLRAALQPDGSSQGHGLGGTRAGIARNGQLPALLPSQLALPRMVLVAKKSRDELLYRTRMGDLSLAAQPMVLLLDDTPATFGAVGVTLRFVANLLAGLAIRRHRRCALVPLGTPRLEFLNEPADLVHVWAEGTVERPDLATALAVAGSAAAQLSDSLDGLPRLVVLTHPYLACPGRPGLHIVRVRYPGVPAEDPAPRTHMLAHDAGPEEIHEVIAGILSDRS